MFQINSKVLLAAVILISNVYSDFGNYDDYGGPTTAGFDLIEEELHMDSVPTGYLPDSVYRELAWYGILQIQPLYYSSKHKVAAQWIWQNTLGRPHVILENSPQWLATEQPELREEFELREEEEFVAALGLPRISVRLVLGAATESDDKASHQVLVEESAKWVREQRSAIDVLMENIRAGGNGLTVRTVISATKKTAYIIQNGKYFECEPGSEPDVDAFRAQSIIHERKCTKDKKPKLVPLDICIEAEFTEIEYSFIDGWCFCMGDGERDASYTKSGDLDCGQKKKVSYSHFLQECAIDKNVVITYEYFGDEPRKDLIRNTTICSTWDPCRFSYLYRIEIPSKSPEIPSTTLDPCDRTFCPECEDVNTDEKFVPPERHELKSIMERKEVNTDEKFDPPERHELKSVMERKEVNTDEKFVPGEGEEVNTDEKFIPAEREEVNTDEKFVPPERHELRSVMERKEVNTDEKFVHAVDEKLVVRNNYSDDIEWVEISTLHEFPKYESKTLKGGHFSNGLPIYVMRAHYENMTIPGTLLSYPVDGWPHIGFNGTEIRVDGKFEIAIPKNSSNLEWMPAGVDVFDNAIPVGVGVQGYIIYLCRALVDGNLLPGGYYKEHNTCYVTFKGKVLTYEKSDILIHTDPR